MFEALLQYECKYFLDTNGDGSKRDEYVVTSSDSNCGQIAICSDQTGTSMGPYPASWWFVHGGRAGGNVLQGRGSINVLYGDGHVESKRPNDLKARWGVPTAGW